MADDLYQADLNDCTYTFIKNPEQNSITARLFAALETIAHNLDTPPAAIFLRKDTVISGQPCYNFFVEPNKIGTPEPMDILIPGIYFIPCAPLAHFTLIHGNIQHKTARSLFTYLI